MTPDDILAEWYALSDEDRAEASSPEHLEYLESLWPESDSVEKHYLWEVENTVGHTNKVWECLLNHGMFDYLSLSIGLAVTTIYNLNNADTTNNV